MICIVHDLVRLGPSWVKLGPRSPSKLGEPNIYIKEQIILIILRRKYSLVIWTSMQ